jgi:prepilin-type N-terminal cleavage/methylation domain-containing protein
MKKAFTLLELIFVIIVIGILAALILPQTKVNSLQDAALQVQSDIRYTQHLAMIDDKFNANDTNWYKKRWQIIFSKQDNSNDQWAYTIFSDTNGDSTGRPNEDEIAINPMNHKQRMTGGYNSVTHLDINDASFVGMKKMNLGMSYGITDINFSCTQRFSFDYLGRPIKSDLSSNSSPYDNNDLIYNDCNITLKNNTDSITIQISPETGYTKIFY